MGNWITEELESCLSAIIDYRGKTPTKTLSGIPLITAKIVKAGRIDAPTEFIAEKDYKSWMTRGYPKLGDVILTTEAPLGEVAQINDERIALAQRIILLRGKENYLDNSFLKYFLISDLGQSQLVSRSSGTTVFGIKQSELRRIKVTFPPIAEQRRIAAILSALDDKIELHRRMNATLEAMAQALFKAWFVDFEPVRANLSQRPSESAAPDIAKLFPAEFVNGLPQGWQVRKLGEVLELAYGKALKEENRVNGAIPVFGSNGQVGWHKEPLVKRAGIVVGRKGNPGTVVWVDEGFFPIDTTFYVKSPFDLRFIFYLLKSLDLPNLSADSAVPGLNRNVAYKESVIVPDNNIIESFGKMIAGLYKRKFANKKESQQLTQIRDALLPRLLSGKIRVDAAAGAL